MPKKFLSPLDFSDHANAISKSALVDLVFDLLTRMHGEDKMGRVNELFNEAFAPVARYRGDRVPRLEKKHLYHVTFEDGRNGAISAFDEDELRRKAGRFGKTAIKSIELIR